MRKFPAYYLVGHQGEETPCSLIAFPRLIGAVDFRTSLPDLGKTDYWYRLIPRREFVEHLVWELFPLESWVDYVDREWFDASSKILQHGWKLIPEGFDFLNQKH